MTIPPINYGNLQGKFFTQWRIEVLVELAVSLAERCQAADFYIHYDANEDYHILVCSVAGHEVTFHFYKVYRLTIGKEVRRFMRSHSSIIPHRVNEIIKIVGK